MQFPPFKYMEWAKLAPAGAVNLSRSGLPAPRLEDLGIDFGGLSLYGDHPYGYSPLIEAIAARSGVSFDNVILTFGVSQAIFLIALAFLQPGDGTLIESPAYEPLVSVPRALGAKIGRIERPFAEGYRIDFGRLEEALKSRPKLVFLTNLHNPSGVRLSRDEIAEVAERSARVGARVFVDEVYLEFLGGPEGRTAFGLAPNIVTACSLTKAYGLAGLRCGWILAPADLVPTFRHIVDHVFVEHVYIAEQMAARIFPRLDAWRESARPLLEQNRERVSRFIAGEARLEWVEPDGGIVGFPRLKGGPTGDELARVLRESQETSVVPGSFFEDPAHFRLGYGVPADVLERGLESIRRVLAEG